MDVLNVEIKAKLKNPERIRKILKDIGADFKGEDHQVDTYFRCPMGRLKLRKGNLENALIYYQRDNIFGPRESEVTLEKLTPENNLRDVLKRAFGILTEVDKRREIYFVDNVKIHIDQVLNLGTFLEIEAIDTTGLVGRAILQGQCEKFIELFGVEKDDLIGQSYSDMQLLELKSDIRE